MKINVKDEKKVQEALNKVQSRTSVREFSAADVADEARRAEKELSRLQLSKRERQHARWRAGHENMPAAYGYRARGTIVVLERGATGWFLISASRDDCEGVMQNGLQLTESHVEAIVARLRRVYRVRTP